ncbi:hypothetical protein [Chitinophaga vietnamensis]|uniref:hypothetical protein n=1 Tax=Chitinophaga vietnamensis TaxID=2593957 RepID=UPI00117899E0|nr:hypothetical protein [Chitinophaga vietnamensis]
MKCIFNAKTAALACLAVTVVTLSSFTHASSTGALGKGKLISNQVASAIVPGQESASYLTPIPTTYVITPTLYIVRITALRTAILDYPTADIVKSGPVAGPGLLNEAEMVKSKMSRLD